ncbi:MAG TPA: D-glucuronyl C5-epimerase family protein [Solirubrobacterales bacterium]|jgi:hypothetical protein|nr:D-glucuronyl C5-epimerase family protein [Solirubrobacterales bacterium]
MNFFVPSSSPTRGAAVPVLIRWTIVVCCALSAYMILPGAAAAASSWSTNVTRLENDGKITPELADSARKAYLDARGVRRRTSGARRTALSYTIRTAESIAKSRRLTPDRVRPLWATLRRNADWFKNNGPAAAGTDRRFGDSRIIFQYFAGLGWQIHPLSNFAKLNAVWTDKSKPARRALGEFAHELMSYGVNRGGFLTWEYYFNFGGGSPPWTSGISQGTAIQALARSGNALNDNAILAAARQGVGAYETAAPLGIKVPRDDGNHYLIYSFNKRLLVLNGFLQSLNGLRDYSLITDDKPAYDLYLKGLTAARKETRESDTGAWSLYSVGGRESTMHYHLLLRDFLGNLCDNNREEVFCGTRDRFTAYTKEDPKISAIKTRVKKGRIYVYFRLSKMSRVTVSSQRAGKTSATASSVVSYGNRRFSLKAPKRAGKYTIRISASDLAGNRGGETTTVKVPRKRSK